MLRSLLRRTKNLRTRKSPYTHSSVTSPAPTPPCTRTRYSGWRVGSVPVTCATNLDQSSFLFNSLLFIPRGSRVSGHPTGFPPSHPQLCPWTSKESVSRETYHLPPPRVLGPLRVCLRLPTHWRPPGHCRAESVETHQWGLSLSTLSMNHWTTHGPSRP